MVIMLMTAYKWSEPFKSENEQRLRSPSTSKIDIIDIFNS